MWFDPLVMTVSADSIRGARDHADAALIKANLPGVRSTGGLSNVSFGLPNRPLINRTFVAMCAGIGIDGASSTCEQQMMATIKAIEALRNEDTFCGRYLNAHRAGLLE